MCKKYYNDNETFLEEVSKNFKVVNTLLDVGCGIRPFYPTFVSTNINICIEPHKEYIDYLRKTLPVESNYIFLNTDALTGIKTFADNAVDTVCMIDLIEHLDKKDGFKLLKEADRVARRQVIVFTPLGFMPQHYEKGEKDAWGLNGAEFQEHKPGWLPEDFEGNWEFHICEDYIKKENCHVPIEKDYGAFFAIKPGRAG